MILPIRLYGDPVLRNKARPVSDFSGIPALAKDMLETMYEAAGVGLAAPQVGLGIRMFVAAEFVDDPPEQEGEEPKSRVVREYVIVNPKLTVTDATSVKGLEGCLSIPQLYEDDVPRAQAVRLEFQDQHAEPHSLEFEGYMARVMQHEFDHLEGKLFLDHLPSEVTQNHRQELAEMQRQAKAFLKEQSKGKKP